MYSVILGLNVSFYVLIFMKHGRLWRAALPLYFSEYFSNNNTLRRFAICQIWHRSIASLGHLEIWGMGMTRKELSLGQLLEDITGI